MRFNRFVFLCLLLILAIGGCAKKEEKGTGLTSKAFPKNTPQPLNYENLSVLIGDMKTFSQAAKKIDRKTVNEMNSRYVDVYFSTEQQPLLLNLYPDPANHRVIHLVVPKDPKTGSDFVLRFDKKLPIIDSNQILLELHTSRPDAPLTCPMQADDLTAYMKDYQTHKYVVKYKLFKRFSQSGTYDFDAISYPAYRVKGLPFIVFDIVSAQLTDLTTNATADCK
jgi:hypothetical protein